MIYQSEYPHKLKKAQITPVHKNKSKSDPQNYRPITITSYISKICERLIYNRINDFLIKYHVLYKYQYGFRRAHNGELILISIMDDIYKAKQKNEYVLFTSLDLKCAYDSVNHQILLQKLEKAGIRGFLLQWFKSYLSNRTHCTKVNGFTSDDLTLKLGLPQGAILSSLLYNIFINDIKEVLPNDCLKLYADDTSLITSDKSLKCLLLRTQSYLEKLSNYFKENKLKVNTNKSEYMIIKQNKTMETQPTLYINNDMIKYVNEIKYLGVFIDDKLNFKKHTSYINGKISHISILYKIRNLIPINNLRQYYFAKIQSRIRYCIAIYGNS